MQTETTKTNGHAAPPVRPELAVLKVTEVEQHPNNPRKTFHEIDELAASIKEHGQLEPIMVRPRGKGAYQIVFGERRWRAIKKAGLVDVLAIVRELSDEQCEEIMVVENTKRSDLHPLEEAEGYERLHTVHRKSVEEIAAKVGKTPAVIYARMKLCALCKKARDAFYAGTIDASKALLLARIPREDLQVEALKAISAEREFASYDLDEDIDPAVLENGRLKVAPSYREAVAIVQSKFMLRLVDAPFDRASTTLVAKAGACTACPKRTGNQKELFADVKSADVCTDPKCYAEKVDAHWAELKKREGVKVLEGKEAKALFPHSDRLTYSAPYVDLDEKVYKGSKHVPIRETLGKKALENVIYARDPNGKIHELVKKQEAKPAAVKISATEKKQRAEERERRKKENAKAAVEAKCNELAIAAMVAKAEGKQPAAELWRALIVAIVTPYEIEWTDREVHQEIDTVLVARKLLKEDEDWNAGDVEKAVGKLSEKAARGLLVELAAAIAVAREPHERGAFDMLCDFYKVDPKKFQAEAKASVGGGK